MMKLHLGTPSVSFVSRLPASQTLFEGQKWPKPTLKMSFHAYFFEVSPCFGVFDCHIFPWQLVVMNNDEWVTGGLFPHWQHHLIEEWCVGRC